MAFWGVEVKPGLPFTHTSDDGRGRLHISQATLGIGAATKRILVQCNVGNTSPVLICSLFPGMSSESCQLHLEFEEADDVVFSVIGPRSVHLTGYFLGAAQQRNNDDASESYGEDIAETETERSAEDSDEDRYGGSFIDDDSESEIDLPSPESSGGVKEKSNIRQCKRRRLRKKYRPIDSDDEPISQQRQAVANGCDDVIISDSEMEDTAPISSLRKIKSPKGRASNTSEKDEREMENAENKAADEPKSQTRQSSSTMSCATPNKKMKKKSKERKELETGCEDDFFFGNDGLTWDKNKEKEMEFEQFDQNLPSLNGVQETANDDVMNNDKARQDKTEAEDAGLDKPVKLTNNGVMNNDKAQDKTEAEDARLDKPVKLTNDGNADLPLFSELFSTKSCPDNCAKKKRKRKDEAKETSVKVDSGCHDNVIEEDKLKQDKLNYEKNCNDQSVPDEQTQKQNVLSGDDNHSEKKKKKKNKKENGNEMPIMSMDEKTSDHKDIKDDDRVSSKHGSLSNELTFEELEAGKPDGKIASVGRKISIRYTGKLKDSGEVFGSNIDGVPLKFRLGQEKVLGGWDGAFEGMRVGEKRRFVIPPILGYGSEGDGKDVPPNSWLEYDIELLKVR